MSVLWALYLRSDLLCQCVQGYLSQKKVALLYINGKWAEKEIRETPPFTIATNNIK